MDCKNVIEGRNLVKKFKGFELNIPVLDIPEGFATALIGENGAGKTTLLNMMAGIRNDYEGSFRYFDQFDDKEREKNPEVKLKIGYTGTDNYYLPHWNIADVCSISSMLFENFDADKFKMYCKNLAIIQDYDSDKSKKVSSLSDGTRTKLMLAGILARNTDLWILDEPASPLDPLMRDKLNDIIRSYIESREGRTVFFSTHNIMDMESVTDYAIIMEHGNVVEAGFVEDLKEKYILVKGEKKDADAAAPAMYTMSRNNYGFEGICLAENLDRLAGLDVTTETPNLSQISVAIMKKNTFVI